MDAITKQFIIIYSMYAICTLVLTIVLFKVFPKAKMILKGPFQNFNLSATGAIGGFIVISFFGFRFTDWASTAIDRKLTSELRRDSIDQAENGSYVLKATINLVKSDGQTVIPLDQVRALLYGLSIEPTTYVNGQNVIFFVPKKLFDLDSSLLISLHNFEPRQMKPVKAPGASSVFDLGVITMKQGASEGQNGYSAGQVSTQGNNFTPTNTLPRDSALSNHPGL